MPQSQKSNCPPAIIGDGSCQTVANPRVQIQAAEMLRVVTVDRIPEGQFKEPCQYKAFVAYYASKRLEALAV